MFSQLLQNLYITSQTLRLEHLIQLFKILNKALRYENNLYLATFSDQ